MSLERVRKLFALAADQQGTPEGEAAARVARRLMRARSLELAGLDESVRQELDPFTRRQLLLGGPRYWRCRLVTLVARHCECIAGYVPGTGKASLYGRRSAVDVAEYLYVVFSRTLTLERVLFLSEIAELPDEERVRRVNNFSQSAMLALELRLQQAREQEDDKEFALVRDSGRGLRRWLDSQGRTLQRELPFPFAYDEAGYKAGYRLPLQDALD